ncbi:hypothetical protein ACKWTF_006386 [Chironomus riparius]
MFPKREPYKTILKISTIFGLWNDISKWHKRISIFLILICSVGYTAIVTLSALQVKELDDVIEIIKVAPLLLTVNFSLLTFLFKKPKIRELLELIENIEELRPDSKNYFDEAFKVVKRLFLCEVVFIGLLAVPFISIPLILKKLIFPLYIPESVKDHQITFIIAWIFESFSGLYCGVLYLLIYEFQLSIFIVLNCYMKFFRDKLKRLRASKENSIEAKNQLVDCVKIHREMNKY